MRILQKRSLIATVDSFNEAIFFGRPWQHEAEDLIAWVSKRLGGARGYAGSFALTDEDWDREFRLFTGEKVNTRVARAHILAEESTRMLTIIRDATGLDSEARTASEERLTAQIFTGDYDPTKADGVYCCAKCSLAFWRAIVAGCFGSHSVLLEQAVRTLAAARDGKGGWKPFPFYYTLLFLTEAGSELASSELEYCSTRLQRAKRLLLRKEDPISKRRSRLIGLATRQTAISR